MNKRLTVSEAAKFIGVCKQRITAKINQGHFPNAQLCECGKCWMIPVSDLTKDVNKINRRKRISAI